VESPEIGTVSEDVAVTIHLEQGRVSQTREVVAEGGCRDSDLLLDLTSRCTSLRALDDQTQDGKANGVSKGLEALCVLIDWV
jgi:hypothetical protein